MVSDGSDASSSAVGGLRYLVRADAYLTPERGGAYEPSTWLMAKKLIDGVDYNDVPWVNRGNTAGGGLVFSEDGEDVIYHALIRNPYFFEQPEDFFFEAINYQALELGTDDVIDFGMDWKIEVFNVGTVDLELGGKSYQSATDPGDFLPDVVVAPGDSVVIYERAVLYGSNMSDRVELQVKEVL